MKEYNLQPYDEYGDTTGYRNLAWYRSVVYSNARNFLDGKKTCLDLGCGNGRHFSFLSECFEEVYGIDPEEDLHPNFHYGNCSHSKMHLHEVGAERQFNAIVMFGSEKSIRDQYNEDFFYEIDLRLSDIGVIVSLTEIKDRYNISNGFPGLSMTMQVDQKTLLTVCFKGDVRENMRMYSR
jgi:23S rRNA U2552 (ribose-2'-O)-methylase RlmE/FtsJ